MCKTEQANGHLSVAYMTVGPVGGRAISHAARRSALLTTVIFAAVVVALATPRAAAQAYIGPSGNPATLITDNDPTGESDTIEVLSHGTILDLDVGVYVPHGRPGDIVVTLTHVDTGTTVTLIDRPGWTETSGGVGCETADIDALLDDEGGNTAEGECNPPADPGIDGRVIPNEPLSTFDGEDIHGTWEMNVSDREEFQTGVFVIWSLRATLDPLPDGFGYRLATSSDPSGPAFNFVDISSTGLFAVKGDDTSSRSGPPDGITSAIPLSAPFSFYGVTYNQMVMASDGYLTTDVDDFSGDNSNDCLLPADPSLPAATTGARIYVLHGDLDLADGFGEGLHQYFASCPRFYDGGGDVGCQVFMWDDVADSPGGAAVNTWDMEAILYDNGDIVLQYASGVPGSHRNKTIGIQSAATGGLTPPDFGLTYACDRTSAPRTGFLSSFLAIWIFLDADGNGFPDAAPDADADGTPDYRDGCPNDPAKLEPGTFGCGVSDADADGDGVPDHLDNCPNDPAKLDLGLCGCGTPDSSADADADGVIDCLDNCPNASNPDQADADANGVGDACEQAPGGQPAGGCGCGAGSIMFMPLMWTALVWMRRRRVPPRP